MFKLSKKSFYIILFGILWLITAFSSFFHAVEFFELTNNTWMGIILAMAFEIGQAAVLMSILTSKEDRKKYTPWVLMCILTLVQIIGNVYSSYKYIIINSPENLKYFKEPIFIWTQLPDAEATVIITYVSAAILPIVALLMTSMITNYLSDQENESVKEIESDGPPEGEGRSDKQEIEDLNTLVDKKDEEIEKLKQELEKSNNQTKEFTHTIQPDYIVPVEPMEDPEGLKELKEKETIEHNINDLKEQDDEEFSQEQESIESPEDIRPSDEGESNVEEEQVKKPSHFINL